MNYQKRSLCQRTVSIILSAMLCLTGCGTTKAEEMSAESSIETTADTIEAAIEAVTALNQIDRSKWSYNEKDDVYWQVGISYCENPADEVYETLGIFVPGAYMDAVDNGDGTYTCKVNTTQAVGGYTAETAPIVIPVNTPGYSAMAAPTDYVSSAADYTLAGFVYVAAGCRGRDAGAPAGVTDLKAAIRYIRYNEAIIPGSMDRIFSFGMSGGGAQSALLGATGDSELYTPYLEAIGAVQGVSDAVAGSMCWCPITSLDYANEAYEWNLGVTRTDLDEETQQLSNEMAEAFAQYINNLKLTDEEGNILLLEESEKGIYQAGSYYEYLKSTIEESLNHFLEDTSFPYSANTSDRRSNMIREDMGQEGDLQLPEDGQLPDRIENHIENGPPETNFTEGNPYRDDINRNETTSGISLTDTYETVQDYINALNANTQWVLYDSENNTAAITNIADFVSAFKAASKNVGAFDDLNATQGENILFGYGDGSGAHFDAVMAELLQDNEAYNEAYQTDLSRTDALGNSVAYRMNMYNPMYYLSDYYEGYGTSNVASYWRIRTGINQGDTALTTELNLALALESYGKEVDFETVWGQGHTQAERTGDATSNFIEWVKECLSK